MGSVWYVGFYAVAALVAAAVCLGWALTASTVSAQINDCGPVRPRPKGVEVQSCQARWVSDGRPSIRTITYDAPAPAGQQQQLSVGGFGTQGVSQWHHLSLAGLGLTTVSGVLFTFAFHLYRHLPARQAAQDR